MVYFTTEFIEFFKELAPNNHKDWFDENRKRYHEHVKKPFEVFVQELIDRANKIDSEIDIPYNKAIFRINRDIRFSKNKEPYKISRSAIISAGGTKNKSLPGLYFEINPEEVRVYSGLFQMDKHQLQRVREEIAENLKEFNALISDKDFVETFGEIRGEKNVRIPKEFKDIENEQPLIANKQFYYFTKLPLDIIYTDEFPDIVMAHYTIAKPLADFFTKPVKG